MFFTFTNPITYHMSGKFIADSDQWIHYSRSLTDYELMVVINGTLYIENENQKYTVNQGEYLLMTPCQLQRGYKKSSCSFYWLHVYHKEPQILPDSLQVQESIKIPLQAKLTDQDRVIVLLKQLQDSDKRYHNQKFNSILARAIITEIEMQVSRQKKEEKKYSQEHLLEQVKEYIQWHKNENLRVNEIASYFGYNEKYLTTLFHKITGTALKQYLLQNKMEQAKILLTDTSLQISQIAYKLGFEDSHNFSNAFKKVTGLSPKTYRKTYGKEKINREK